MANSGPVAPVSRLAPAWRNVLSLSLFSAPGRRTGHLVGTYGTRMVLHTARYWYIEEFALSGLFRVTKDWKSAGVIALNVFPLAGHRGEHAVFERSG